MVWFDEILAILLIVFGFVSIFSLLNTSSAASLSTMWSDALRQLFGFGGALIASGMIITTGLLIVLPRIGIRIPMPWTRVVLIEVAYFALLALVHILAHDREPRALAASGQGGGYIGWVLSEPLVRLLGTGFAGTIYVLVIVFALSNALGIKRKHIRQILLRTSQTFAAVAERMKRPPQPQRVQQARAQAHAVAVSTNGGNGIKEDSSPVYRPDPMARPLQTSVPSNPASASLQTHLRSPSWPRSVTSWLRKPPRPSQYGAA